MNFKNYDVALITDEKQRMYFLGFHSTAGYVLITKEKTYFVVDNRYLKAAEKALNRSRSRRGLFFPHAPCGRKGL